MDCLFVFLGYISQYFHICVVILPTKKHTDFILILSKEKKGGDYSPHLESNCYLAVLFALSE